MNRLLLVLLTAATSPVIAAQERPAPQCRPAGLIATVTDLSEGSGIAVSRRTPGRLWALNDSGKPVLVALDSAGSVTGRVELSGATVEDWEALASGSCGGSSCLYVADIGDNDARRRRVTVFRIPEPAAQDRSAAVSDVFHATYPDGPQDAEALIVAPDGGLAIVTKGETRSVGLYRFPKQLTPGATHTLERVGKPRESARAAEDQRITDASMSPDGAWIALRTTRSLAFHRAVDLLAGNWREAGHVDLGPLGEPQGEGVAIGPDSSVYLAGEGGGSGRPGTIARLTCRGLGPA